MGAVYQAEQLQPHRIVALKVIKSSFLTPELLRRFTRESEALARLHHPGIAQIYEAGTAEGDFGPQPFFAMEFIQGSQLDAYARKHNLTTRERLQLVARVCDAVQHAHQRGIIHRDLKPGNILVDESGNPRILDFGVARMTDAGAQVTRATDLGQLVGTLAYMSPEQVLADPHEIDTRSDVYSLGVILYELLARRLPCTVPARLHEAVQAIREQDPARLSSLDREYRGDIDTIVAKALEKEKSRRYASAAELAADIRRHLDHQPIAARRASASYQLGKFARRNKAMVAGVAAVFVALLAGIGATGLQLARALRAERSAVTAREAASRERDRAVEAEQQANRAGQKAAAAETEALQDRDLALQEKQRADREAESAKAVADFLQYDLLAQAGTDAQAGSGTTPDPNLSVHAALNRAAARIDGKFGNQPALAASILRIMAESYRSLGQLNDAEAQALRSLDLLTRHAGGDTKAIVQTRNLLAQIYLDQGRYLDAEPFLKQTLALERRTPGLVAGETVQTIAWLARNYCGLERYREAEEFARRAMAGQSRASGKKSAEAVLTPVYLAEALRGQGRLEEAGQWYEQLLEGARQTLGEYHPTTLYAKRAFGRWNADIGRLDQAAGILTDLLETYRRVQGPVHPTTLVAVDVLADVLLQQGKREEFLALRIQTLELVRAAYGADSPATFSAMANLAAARERTDDFASAEGLWSSVLEGRRRVLGSGRPDTLMALSRLAFSRLQLRKFVEAEPVIREVLAVRKAQNADSWLRYNDEFLLGVCLAGQGRFADAEPLLTVGYEGLLARRAGIPKQVQFYLKAGAAWIVGLYRDWGKPDVSAAWAQRLQLAGVTAPSRQP